MKTITMIETVPECPHCGQWDPWRQYAKRVKGLAAGEVARKYVKCRRCGQCAVISVRRK